MSTFTKSAFIATVLATANIMASAANASPSGIRAYGAKPVAMQDGSTLHFYKDGLMAMENAFGRPTVVASGQLLHEQNGTTITMNGDEVAKLSMEKI